MESGDYVNPQFPCFLCRILRIDDKKMDYFIMCLSSLLSRTKNCSLASNGARSWCVTERSDLGSPFGRAGCPVRGSLRGSHVPIYAFNHQTEYPLSQPVRLTALPKGEPRALPRQCGKLQFFRRDTYDGRAIIHPRFHKKLPRESGEVVSVIGCCRRFGL